MTEGQVQNSTEVFKVEKGRQQHLLYIQIETLIASGLALTDTINPPLQ